jgi:hypothetical protein
VLLKNVFLEKFGYFNTFSDCHEECADNACTRPNDDTACVTCKQSKFFNYTENAAPIVKCVANCDLAENLKIKRLDDETLKDRNDQIICGSCHWECKEKCRGLTGLRYKKKFNPWRT